MVEIPDPSLQVTSDICIAVQHMLRICPAEHVALRSMRLLYLPWFRLSCQLQNVAFCRILEMHNGMLVYGFRNIYIK